MTSRSFSFRDSNHFLLNMKTWTPTEDPSQIYVPGLDPNAPYEDQIELLDQLITLKLQVC